MIESSSLLGINYLKNEYFREGEEERQRTRSLWLNILKKELNIWDYNRTVHPIFSKLKHWMYYKIPKLTCKLFNHFSTKKGKIMWIGAIGDKWDFLFKSQPYNLVVTDVHPSLSSFFQLIFTSNLSLCPIYSSYTDTFNGILNYDEKRLQKGLDILKNIFNHINPDVIVLNDDALPIHRAIVLVARELGIPTVEIQHGIYVGKFVTTGREADYLFVFGRHFKDFYVKNKIKDPKHIKILGYPYRIRKKDICNDNKEKKLVIYLGQNYDVYNKDLISNKIETIKNIQKICKKLGFDFVYRPHPSDDMNIMKSKLKDVTFTPDGETLSKSFENGDIFISFDSTALVEATLNSKVAIQFKNYDILTDNFEEIGACSKSVETFEKLEIYLEQIKNGELSSFYRPVKKDYMEIPLDPGIRFLELIEKII